MAIAFVQEVISAGIPAQSAGVATVGVPAAHGVTAGNLLVLWISTGQATQTGAPFTLTDSKGNTYTLIGNYSSNFQTIRLYSCLVGTALTAGTDSWVLTYSDVVDANSGGIQAYEFSGVTATLDGSVYSVNNPAQSFTIGPVTTTVQPDLLFAALSDNTNASTFYWSLPYVQQSELVYGGNQNRSRCGYNIVSGSAGNQYASGTAPVPTSGTWVLAGFKGTGAVAPPPRQISLMSLNQAVNRSSVF